jgi:integrase/recombinase XerD
MKLGLTTEEREKLVSTIRKALESKSSKKYYTWLRDYVTILLGLEAGLRSSEASHIYISHVWFGGDVKATMLIEENFNKKCKEGIIPLSPNLVKALREYVPVRLLWLPKGQEDGYLLSNKPGKRRYVTPLSCAALHYIVRYWASQAKIEPFRFHDLRHTFGSNAMLADHSNLKMVQDLLRHRNIQSTEIYLHPTVEQYATVIKNAFPESS